jgi:hypothetical protein
MASRRTWLLTLACALADAHGALTNAHAMNPAATPNPKPSTAAPAANSPAARALSAVEAGDRAALDKAHAAGADPSTRDAKGVPLMQLALKRRDPRSSP